MSRQKRTSRSMTKAEIRLSGMQSIDAQLDLGNNLTLEIFNTKIAAVRQKLQTYNLILATLDAMATDLTESERDLSAYSTKMLAGIGHIFGKDSAEYEKAGGVRIVERRRSSPRRSTETANRSTETVNPVA